MNFPKRSHAGLESQRFHLLASKSGSMSLTNTSGFVRGLAKGDNYKNPSRGVPNGCATLTKLHAYNGLPDC